MKISARKFFVKFNNVKFWFLSAAPISHSTVFKYNDVRIAKLSVEEKFDRFGQCNPSMFYLPKFLFYFYKYTTHLGMPKSIVYLWQLLNNILGLICLINMQCSSDAGICSGFCIYCMYCLYLCMYARLYVCTCIDTFEAPTRPVEKPFRCSVADIFKGMFIYNIIIHSNVFLSYCHHPI